MLIHKIVLCHIEKLEVNKNIQSIYLILILILNLSCAENKESDKKADSAELAKISKTDTLKFTSGIRSIFQDSKGNYWFGSHSEGISRYNGKSFEYFTTKEGLQDNQIRSIQEDEEGIIWIVTARGVNAYNGDNMTSYSTEFNSPISDWNATTGDLWFYAGEEDGIYRFDGMNMNYLTFPKPKNTDPYNSFGVTGISKDKNGAIWIATYSALFSYDDEIVDIFEHKKLNLEDNESLHVRSILADSQGRIWIGNNGIGVILINGDSITHFSKEQGKLLPIDEFRLNTNKNQTAKNTGLQSVFAIEEDYKGNIWFGDRDSGAWKYDGKTLTNYQVDIKLKPQMIWSIYEDQNKNLLFGMNDGGIYKFNGRLFDKWF
ncbi:two-component regulator propeller domain-containing protein [Echinicola sp. 20G]|uniref:ligand-binding sensor domain-containing protein n=1 Tax=Echinicola sp. 20G TaxID=2781961 RepID=UPI001F318464|nr:two-component regulator propeller domain-containing protein [Echinicola sp. 20G]